MATSIMEQSYTPNDSQARKRIDNALDEIFGGKVPSLQVVFSFGHF